jgi:hypothetical protein
MEGRVAVVAEEDLLRAGFQSLRENPSQSPLAREVPAEWEEPKVVMAAQDPQAATRP